MLEVQNRADEPNFDEAFCIGHKLAALRGVANSPNPHNTGANEISYSIAPWEARIPNVEVNALTSWAKEASATRAPRLRKIDSDAVDLRC